MYTMFLSKRVKEKSTITSDIMINILQEKIIMIIMNLVKIIIVMFIVVFIFYPGVVRIDTWYQRKKERKRGR